MQYYLDSAESLTVDQALERDFHQLIPHNLNTYSGAIWLKLELQNTSAYSNWNFIINHPPLDSIECFVFEQDSLIYQETSGDNFSFANRPVATSDVTFPITLSRGKNYTVYFRAQGERNIFIVPVSISPEMVWIEHIQTQNLFNGICYGVLLLASVYGLLSFLTTRVKSNLYYGIYVLAVLIFFLTQTGDFFHYLIPNNPNLYNLLPITATSSGGIFSILFAREILKIRGKTWSFLATLAAVMLLAPIVQLVSFRVALLMAGLGSAIKVLSYCVITLHLSSKGNATARYLLPAWVIYAVGVGLFMMRNFGFISINFFTSNGLFLATIVEVLILSVAVTVNYRILIREHVMAQESAKLKELELSLASMRLEKLREEKEEKDRKLATTLLKDQRRVGKLVSLREETSEITLRNKLQRLIDSDQNQTNYWENFKVIFEDVHPKFFEALQSDYPQLTVNDLRHFAYIKMNLQVKEISELTGVSVQAVKMARNRLKKKLGQDKSLTEIVADISNFDQNYRSVNHL